MTLAASAPSFIPCLHGRLESYVADLESMVNIDSGSLNRAGVKAVGDLVAEHLVRMRFDVRRVPFERFGPAVVGRRAGSGTQRILIMGHLDTVYPDGTAAARPLHRVGQRLTGPGVSDMKGGVLLGLYAIEALLDSGYDGFAELIFLCTPDEEHAEQESQPLIRSLARQVDVALSLEAARENGDIVSERKGGYVYRLDVLGRAAHAGVEPERGRSAILEAAHKVAGLHDLANPAMGITVMVGLVNGGSQSNVVPERATLTFEVRSPTMAGIAMIEQQVDDLLTSSVVPDIRFDLKRLGGNPPLERTSEVMRLAELAQREATSLGLELRDASTGGGSDACFVSNEGKPALDGLGPVGGSDHSPAEYLDIDSVAPRGAVLAGLIRSIESSGPWDNPGPSGGRA